MEKFKLCGKTKFTESYKNVSPYDILNGTIFIDIRFTVHYDTEEISINRGNLKYDNEFYQEAIEHARKLIAESKL